MSKQRRTFSAEVKREEEDVTRQSYRKLFGIPDGHELKAGDWVYGITTGENHGRYYEKDAKGKAIACYFVNEHLDETGDLKIVWHKERLP